MNSEHEELVTELLQLAQEELGHFEMVHNIIKERGFKLGREHKDHYVNKLYKFMVKGGNHQQAMIDRPLFSAMIETLSCERFKVLSENISDKKRLIFTINL